MSVFETINIGSKYQKTVQATMQKERELKELLSEQERILNNFKKSCEELMHKVITFKRDSETIYMSVYGFDYRSDGIALKGASITPRFGRYVFRSEDRVTLFALDHMWFFRYLREISQEEFRGLADSILDETIEINSKNARNIIPCPNKAQEWQYEKFNELCDTVYFDEDTKTYYKAVDVEISCDDTIEVDFMAIHLQQKSNEPKYTISFEAYSLSENEINRKLNNWNTVDALTFRYDLERAFGFEFGKLERQDM
jgi:hypothetical protein